MNFFSEAVWTQVATNRRIAAYFAMNAENPWIHCNTKRHCNDRWRSLTSVWETPAFSSIRQMARRERICYFPWKSCLLPFACPICKFSVVKANHQRTIKIYAETLGSYLDVFGLWSYKPHKTHKHSLPPSQARGQDLTRYVYSHNLNRGAPVWKTLISWNWHKYNAKFAIDVKRLKAAY